MDEIENFTREKTLYSILGCTSSATKEQITCEYHHRVKTCHPDRYPDNEQLAEEFKR